MSTPYRSVSIRVLLWNVPNLLDGILRWICSHEPDLEIVTPPEVGLALRETVETCRPDVVITGGIDDEAPAAWISVVHAYPQLRLITLHKDGREGYLYRLALERSSLGELSPETLVTAIRTVPATYPCGSPG